MATQAGHPKKWLITYNSVSSSLWTIVLFNTLFIGSFLGQPFLFDKTHLILTIVQLCAIIEIFNSAMGYVKSPLMTTLMQVASRLLIVIGIFQVLPNSQANHHWAYFTLTASWAVTEIIRYSYYASNLTNPGNIPHWLTWARYSLFFVLYPAGVFSEVLLIYLSLESATNEVGTWYSNLLIFILLVYIPGFYVLFTHMLKQRKKVLASIQETQSSKKKE